MVQITIHSSVAATTEPEGSVVPEDGTCVYQTACGADVFVVNIADHSVFVFKRED